MVLPPTVTLRATETDVDNEPDVLWGTSWLTLQHSSAPSPCAGTPGNCGCGPAKQSWIHAHNVSDVSITGGGTIHGGGRYWWCVRSNLASGHQQWQPALQKWGCSTTKALPNTTRPATGELLATCPPRMLHIVESRRITLSGIHVRWAGYWTLHFQFSDQILVENITLWNPSNTTFNAPNGDGIDIDSSTNALVRDSVIDAADDALCIKSGADFLGRAVNRPTENVLFTNIEVRNGHGLTLGSDCSGGARNITWRHIFLNGRGPTCTVGGVHTCGNGIGRGAGPSGPHWKTGRGRGGTWRDIMWDDIYGDTVLNAVAFSGGNYIAAPPTNATATPKIINVTVQNLRLTNVAGGYQGISTLRESPIQGLHLKNISFTMAKGSRLPPWTCVADCTGPARGQGCTTGLFATGTVQDVAPPLPRECQFATPPPSPRPAAECTLAKVLGCYNDSGATHPILPYAAPRGSPSSDHDHVTQRNCAALCARAELPVAGIDQGNHCKCGTAGEIAGAGGFELPTAACQSPEWPCTGACCGPHAEQPCSHGKCTGQPGEHCGGVGALLAFTYTCHPTQ